MTALPMSCNVRFKHVQLQFYCLKVLQFHDLKLFNDSTISISHPYINTTIAEGFTSSHLPYRILRLCRRCSAVCKIHLKAHRYLTLLAWNLQVRTCVNWQNMTKVFPPRHQSTLKRCCSAPTWSLIAGRICRHKNIKLLGAGNLRKVAMKIKTSSAFGWPNRSDRNLACTQVEDSCACPSTKQQKHTKTTCFFFLIHCLWPRREVRITMVMAKKPGSPEAAKKGTTSTSCSKGSHLPNVDSHAVGSTSVKLSPSIMGSLCFVSLIPASGTISLTGA